MRGPSGCNGIHNKRPSGRWTQRQGFFLISSSSRKNSSRSRRAWSICRDFDVIWRWPRIGVSCKCWAHARSCREMLSARDFRAEISDWRSANTFMRSITQSIDRTSPAEPRAIYRNARSSLVVPRSNPSATLFETESAARSIWSRKLRWRRRGACSPNANMRTARLDAACQTGRSSNRVYFMKLLSSGNQSLIMPH